MNETCNNNLKDILSTGIEKDILNMANYEVDVLEMANRKFNLLEIDTIEPFVGWKIADHVLESYNLNCAITRKNPQKEWFRNKLKGDTHKDKSNIQTERDKLIGDVFKRNTETVNHEQFECGLTNDVENLRRLFECNACHKMFITKSKIMSHFAKKHMSCNTKPKPWLRKTIDKSPDSSKQIVNSIESNSGGVGHIDKSNIKTTIDKLNEHVFELKMKIIHDEQVGSRITEDVVNLKSLFKCNACPKMFITKSKIMSHFAKTHTSCITKPKPWLRKTIDKSLDSSKQIVNSIESNSGHDRRIDKSKTKTERYKSTGRVLKTEIETVDNKQVDSGLTKHVNPTRSFDCNTCQHRFATKKHIVRHFVKSHTSCNVKPKPCLRTTGDENEYSSGKAYARNKDGRFDCDVCVRTFLFKSQLIIHERVHTGEKPYKCRICSSSFASKIVLRRHERVHPGEKPFRCSVCEREFSRHDNLKRHELVHTGEKQFKCDVCTRLFAYRHCLKLHERVHTGEKPYKCSVCEKAFSTHDNLKIHNRLHTDARPYKCKVCPKSFRNYTNLKTHNFLHTGEKPYGCYLCEKSFNQRQNLNRHHKNVHTDKKYKCDKCKKSFNRKHYLKRHQDIVHTDKKYKCDKCKKSYSRRAYYNKHQAKTNC
ncbi:zinc finger protein 431-like isoform X1 [Adelges cooleyi]|uniref:zinc finger protein 431-like isoform X1 n=1 Tax=Adelges cooleyi TaxID=133065 RepID=UPI00217F5AE2|nr:zinc finger protein 431-like isoform X1 [Adelges cooleyi]XP_050437745.1 zinc finger protein 431-like isoform X1 [Adelges cooleyi]XP_050437746.1 zinc finger protein 431-like isoform X1 [Adelges cooleyi]